MARKKQEEVPTETGGSCFTIMPFGEWNQVYYEQIYKPAIEDVGLESRLASDLYRPSSVMQDIWVFTNEAKIILADLTGKNPNVFYELGLAHAIVKPVVMVASSLEDVPFDLRGLRVILYDRNSPHWGEKLREEIGKAIRESLDSPLEAVPPTFLVTRKDETKTEVTAEEKGALKLKESVGRLEREILSLKRPFFIGSEMPITWTGISRSPSIILSDAIEGLGKNPASQSSPEIKVDSGAVPFVTPPSRMIVPESKKDDGEDGED